MRLEITEFEQGIRVQVISSSGHPLWVPKPTTAKEVAEKVAEYMLKLLAPNTRRW